jgi:hypothetical protein
MSRKVDSLKTRKRRERRERRAGKVCQSVSVPVCASESCVDRKRAGPRKGARSQDRPDGFGAETAAVGVGAGARVCRTEKCGARSRARKRARARAHGEVRGAWCSGEQLGGRAAWAGGGEQLGRGGPGGLLGRQRGDRHAERPPAPGLPAAPERRWRQRQPGSAAASSAVGGGDADVEPASRQQPAGRRAAVQPHGAAAFAAGLHGFPGDSAWAAAESLTGADLDERGGGCCGRRDAVTAAVAATTRARWGLGGVSDGGVSDGGVSDGGVSDGGVSDGGVSGRRCASPAFLCAAVAADGVADVSGGV